MSTFQKPAPALWEERGYQQLPKFLNRTETEYWRAPYKEVLSQRGIENRLLDSLACSLPDGAIIAGGFMLAVVNETKDASDIDVFFTNEDAFVKAVNVMLNPEEHAADSDPQIHWAVQGYEPDTNTRDYVVESFGTSRNLDQLRKVRYLKFVHKTRPPIQLIKLAWYDSAEHVIDSFDLTVAQFAIDVKSGDLVANPLSFVDAVRKRIVLHRMQFPSSTLRRVIKYSKKGYYACPGALQKLAQEVAENIENDDGQFVYVD